MFAEAAREALAQVSQEPYEVATGQRIVPRDFLRALAVAATNWPETPEVWYGDAIQECFWTLIYRRPAVLADGDQQSAAESISTGVLLAMMSMDRHGHAAYAYLCEIALAYLCTLPAWRDVDLVLSPSREPASVRMDLTDYDWFGMIGRLA